MILVSIRNTITAAFLHLNDVTRFRKPVIAVLCKNSRVQVYDEGENVKGKDGGNNPFENGGNVGMVGKGCAGKDDGEDEFDENKGEFYPE